MPRKIKICIELDCQNAQTAKNYCRLHYLKHHRDIKAEERRKETRRLNRYVEGVIKRGVDRSGGAGAAKQADEGPDGGEPPTSSEEVERLIEDLGYEDPQSLDQMINNLKIDGEY